MVRLCFALLMIALIAGPAAADSCDEQCPGQVQSGFADGNNATCVCLDQSSMENTDETPINCYNPDDDGSCE